MYLIADVQLRLGWTDHFKEPLFLFQNDQAFEIEATRTDCEIYNLLVNFKDSC